ncbi:hypothetical protein ACFYRY_00355 [Streptomyces sp. NPDC005263]
MRLTRLLPGSLRLEDGTELKLAVFLSNIRSRWAKLTADKLQALPELGLG